MELKCPKCGTSCGEDDRFCRTCGAKVGSPGTTEDHDPSFEIDVVTLLKTLNEFRTWATQEKKNVRFMKAYREKLEGEIGSTIRDFEERYGGRKEGRSPLFRHIREAFSALRRPVRYMETRLRPSVGMGVFLERWMRAQTVEDYLKECCQEADHHLEELAKKLESS